MRRSGTARWLVLAPAMADAAPSEPRTAPEPKRHHKTLRICWERPVSAPDAALDAEEFEIDLGNIEITDRDAEPLTIEIDLRGLEDSAPGLDLDGLDDLEFDIDVSDLS